MIIELYDNMLSNSSMDMINVQDMLSSVILNLQFCIILLLF